MKRLVVVMLTLAFGCLSLWAQEQAPASADAYIELMRKDVRSQKVSLVGQNMELTAAEASAFWPVYQKYEAEQKKLGDERVGLIKDYAANYQQMTDQKAEELVSRTFALEDKIIQLQEKKRMLAKELIADDAGFVKKLTRDDIEYLFS